MTSTNKNILVIVVLILLGVGGLFLFHKKNAQQNSEPTVTPQINYEDLTKGWGTYKDDKDHFEIKFPTYPGIAEQGKGIILRSVIKLSTTTLTQLVFSSDSPAPDLQGKMSYQPDETFTIVNQEISIHYLKDKDGYFIYSSLEKDNRLYLFTNTFNEESKTTDLLKGGLFKQFLSTFKFTK